MTTPSYNVRRTEARQILGGVAERTFATLESERVIVPTHRGRAGRASLYDLRVIVPAYIAHLNQAPAAGGEREARRRRDDAQARLTELRIEREQGALVPRDDVLLAGQAQVKAWTAKIRALPRQLVQTGILSSGQEPAVATALRGLLTEIAGWTAIPSAAKAKQPRTKKAAKT